MESIKKYAKIDVFRCGLSESREERFAFYSVCAELMTDQNGIKSLNEIKEIVDANLSELKRWEIAKARFIEEGKIAEAHAADKNVENYGMKLGMMIAMLETLFG